MLVVHPAGTVKIVINVRKSGEDLSLLRIKLRFAHKYVILSKYSFQTRCNLFFVRRRVGAFKKFLILNLSSSSPPPSHFFLIMQLVSCDGDNSFRTNPGDCH
jgi:hypothetical protein